MGKSCILARFIEGTFEPAVTTIGACFFRKVLNYEGKNWILGLWDTAGQERYSSLSSFYCRGAVCAIVAFDLTDRESFENVPKWILKLQTSSPAGNYFTILVGTKVDLVVKDASSRRVTMVEAMEMSDRIDAISYVETSSLTGENVAKIFEQIVSKYTQNVQNGLSSPSPTAKSSLNLNNPSSPSTPTRTNPCC